MMNTPRFKTRRISRAVGALAALALVTAACGGDDDADEGAVDTDAPSDEATADSSDMTEDATDNMTEDMTDDMAECEVPREMSLQLQWFTQAQFAGYFAAIDQGYYENHCLDVTILEGGVDIVPQTQLANGDVDFALAWVPKALASREAGANIVNIAQIFQRAPGVVRRQRHLLTRRLRGQEDRQLGLR
jgi:NitT/TauT family transport system substrate-binding protein